MSSIRNIFVLGLSSPCPPKVIEEALRFFQCRGINAEFSCDPSEQYERKDFLFSCSSIENRVSALDRFIRGGINADLCLSLRGGFGALEVLSHFESPENFKGRVPICGFSDTTALLVALHSLFGVCHGYHGPSFLSFGAEENKPHREEMWEHLSSLLNGSRKQIFSGEQIAHAYGPKEGSGILIGGNLRTIQSLLGTSWQPDFSGKVLFLEELNEKPFEIYRALLQLKNSRGFDQLSGILFGDMLRCVHPRGMGPSVEEVIREVFQNSSFPVFQGAPFGHGARNLALPIGQRASLSEGGLELLPQEVQS